MSFFCSTFCFTNCTLLSIQAKWLPTFAMTAANSNILLWKMNDDKSCKTIAKNHSFSVCWKFSKKLTFLTPFQAHVKCEYKGGRNVGFSENFAYVLKKWPKRKTWNKSTKTWNCLRQNSLCLMPLSRLHVDAH